MRYKNPVLFSDYSDPDVIRAGDGFYMVASSFNNVPAVPVLYSQNLVEWRLINYVLDSLPFERYNAARHGEGVCAPSIRYRDGKFYCLVSFPDEGIFVAETEDPYGKWSLLRPLMEGKGFINPCPVWADGKCYVAFAFDRARAGFDSEIAVFETDENLKTAAKDYKIIFDGANGAPHASRPKIYKKDGCFYLLVSAGGAKNGWLVELRSKQIYGPYESKVVFMQGDTYINAGGGALVDVDDEKWAFVHTRNMGAYGSAVYLQPTVWDDGWAMLGDYRGDKLAGTPAEEGEYPVNISFPVKVDPCDVFDGTRLSLLWHTPANRGDGWFALKRGLRLNCAYYGGNSLANLPQMLLQKICYRNFSVKTKCKLNLLNDGDETGFVVFGKEYAYACVVRAGGQNFLEIRKGALGGGADETLCRSQPYDEGTVTFQLSAKFESPDRLAYRFTFGKVAFTHVFYADSGVCSGAELGIYARSSAKDGDGSVTFSYFREVCTDNRVK